MMGGVYEPRAATLAQESFVSDGLVEKKRGVAASVRDVSQLWNPRSKSRKKKREEENKIGLPQGKVQTELALGKKT